MRPKFQCRFRRASERLFERQRGMRNPSSPPSAPAGGRGGASGKATPCCSKVGLKRGPWTAAEDELLASYIHREGEGRWRTLPKRAGLLRCGKSCRLRWMNYLRPSVKRGHIAADEEDLILRLHRLLGNKWSLIAGRIPGRTDNEIKNYWNTHLSKKLISQGIDPRTHKPLSENPSSSASPTNHHHPLQTPSSPGHGDRYFEEGTNFDSSIAGLRNLEGSLAMGLKRVNAMGSYGGDEEAEAAAAGTIRCGVDDGFSSFFNSLINEEAFSGQHETDALGVQHAGNDDDNHL